MQSSGSRARVWLKFGSGQAFCGARTETAGLMLGSRKGITAYWLPGFVQCLKDAGRADAGPTRFRAAPVWAQTGFGEIFASLVVGMTDFEFN